MAASWPLREVRSGATRSAGTRVRIDFDYLHQRSLYDALLLSIHGCLQAPIANWFPIFPGAPGINSSLRFAHIGNPARKWFSQVPEDGLNVNWEKKWGTKLIFTLGKLQGCPLAEPEFDTCAVAGSGLAICARSAVPRLSSRPRFLRDGRVVVLCQSVRLLTEIGRCRRRS